MANVEYFVFEDTTTNVAAIKRSNLIAYDTTKDSAVYYKEDGTTLRTFLTLDSSYNTLYSLGNMVIGDGKYFGLGATKGRIQFDDETVDTISFLSCILGVGTSAPSVDAGIHIYSNVSAEAPTLLLEQNGSPGNSPRIRWKHNQADANERIWQVGATSSGQYLGQIYSDDENTSVTWLTVDRTAAAITYIQFLTPDFRLAFDAASYCKFEHQDTSGEMKISPIGNCGAGYINLVGDLKMLGDAYSIYLSADGHGRIYHSGTDLRIYARVNSGTGDLSIMDCNLTVPAGTVSIGGSLESTYSLAIKGAGATSQSFMIIEDSAGTDMFTITSSADGDCNLNIKDTAGATRVLIQAITNPAVVIGEAITAGNYGYIRWVDASDVIAIGTETGGDDFTLDESGNVVIAADCSALTFTDRP